MSSILIRTNEIVNCWETKDACIVETRNGKKWVCKKTLYSSLDTAEWNTLVYVQCNQNQEFLFLELIEKGKSDKNA